jgi:Cdc6-like AAA superfamily ATPase
MDAKFAAAISEMPADLKYCIVSDATVITALAKELGDRVIPIILSYKLTYFHTPETIVLSHCDNEIVIKSFGEITKDHSVIVGARTLDIVNSFLGKFNEEPSEENTEIPPDGYLQFTSKFTKEKLITNGSKFSDLLEMEDKSTEVTRRITSYFDNIEKFRTLKCNKGINILLHGPSGSGKTVFARAIAHHYKSNLFVPEDTYFLKLQSQLNPSISNDRMNIVLFDDFSDRGRLREIMQYIQDCASENVVRIFTVEDINSFNKDSFLQCFHVILEFKLPTKENIAQLISQYLDCSTEDSLTLANLMIT